MPKKTIKNPEITPYKITSKIEREEAKWMIRMGYFKNIADYEAAIESMYRCRAATKKKKKVA